MLVGWGAFDVLNGFGFSKKNQVAEEPIVLGNFLADNRVQRERTLICLFFSPTMHQSLIILAKKNMAKLVDI